ncbi:lipopolysaccharide export system permease protein [Polymorphobacter multimanifer]|uniref:Lipopolysaccharide export system permease protein n=1 Tax=Polymorphobacter multimanifer TaxID=1070431 RepID=A0A841LCX6_9SPHN|nr:LptF/LptG family permease [Polymorphobacter multimanifer]MBB6226828.1 lipopolysaccharide export system permease protein [Polymorphobacter multimanifer]
MLTLTRFDRYLARLIIVPLIGSLVIAAMLLVLDRMLRLFDFVMNEGGPVDVVWRMLGNLLPEYLSLGIPIGVMMGVLLAFRGIAISSELDALRAVGISYFRLLRVPFLFATLFAVVNFGIVGWLQPVSRYSYENLRYELRSGALGASIKVGEFASLGKGMTLRVEESLDNGRDLRGLFVRAQGENGQSLAVTAASGTFLSTDDPEVILLRLKAGTLVHSPGGGAVPRVLSFEQHDLPVNLPNMASFRVRGDGNLEATLPELAAKVFGADTPPVERRDASATFHRRLVQCVVMFVLPFLSLALGVPPKRSSSALGVFIALIALVTFHKLTEYGERMGSLGRVDPFLAQWVPFAGFVLFSLWLYRTLAHVPGGQPLGALDRWFGKASKLVSGIVGRLVQRSNWRDDALSAG